MTIARPAALALALAACGPEPPRADLLLTGTDYAPRVIPDRPVARYELRHLRSWGSDSGPEAIGQIAAVGATSRGLLAVADMTDCRILLFDLRTGGKEPVGQVGRCGDGPGELRFLRAVDFVGDTLVAHHALQPLVQFLTLDGAEVGRRPIAGLLSGTESVQSLEPVAGGQYALAIALPSRASGEGGLGENPVSIRLLDLPTGRTLAEALGPAPVSQANPGNLTEGPELCVGTLPDGSRRLAAMNRWAIEGVILSPDSLRQMAHMVLEGDYGTAPFPPPMHGYLPDGLGSAVVCTALGPLYWRLEGSSVDRKPVISGGRVLLTDWDGSPLLNLHFGPSDSVLFNRPMAAVGDRVFAASNVLFDYPMVHEFRLVEAGGR